MRQQCLVQITHVQYTQHNGYVHAPTNKINIVYKFMYIEKQKARVKRRTSHEPNRM